MDSIPLQWTTLLAEGGSEIISSQSGTPEFTVVAYNDQVVMAAASAGIHTVWSIEAIGGSSNVFKVWLTDRNLVWTLGEGKRIVLRPPEEGLSEQEIEFAFFG
ncbi:hypothetical protein P691DRAFT_775451 [Macrolepiota fuliginosa MF-IS2]|uniref:Uncharacterized protein n=1 Tax=Macrolepiota fuliginosa MF-IS2 TaxID=1400762 RepID=A0A9P5XBM7_9AGAR|nr:hypothetical protein P691DRAFT_775451 [Macrolepiota fuliginosa MF-IS2]